MKKKALATFLSVCMLATVAVPTAIVSATTDSGMQVPVPTNRQNKNP